ncbi:uncharacterized protein H6S33_007062 [Morchella sextelata]|uniref:uncharacterized protein n=1 Tax=Morchella sextelata TaxID=1174677 RepID=UPI001D058161|nr:uncharacterized protein H6S33_007062 [Morchella sextelata]KAH0604031.1 hypothetical protein H6S33_007062 [Morchella sextelata]
MDNWYTMSDFEEGYNAERVIEDPEIGAPIPISYSALSVPVESGKDLNYLTMFDDPDALTILIEAAEGRRYWAPRSILVPLIIDGTRVVSLV